MYSHTTVCARLNAAQLSGDVIFVPQKWWALMSVLSSHSQPLVFLNQSCKVCEGNQSLLCDNVQVFITLLLQGTPHPLHWEPYLEPSACRSMRLDPVRLNLSWDLLGPSRSQSGLTMRSGGRVDELLLEVCNQWNFSYSSVWSWLCRRAFECRNECFHGNHQTFMYVLVSLWILISSLACLFMSDPMNVFLIPCRKFIWFFSFHMSFIHVDFCHMFYSLMTLKLHMNLKKKNHYHCLVTLELRGSLMSRFNIRYLFTCRF